MRLLVSVRSPAEAEAALAGGADIVDAKEPARGPLGPVAPAVLREISAAVPSGVPLSIALGDFTRPDDAASAVAAAAGAARRPGALYLKLGFTRVASERSIGEVIEAAVAAARRRGNGVAVVAAAYADHEAAGTLPPVAVASVAARRGASGVLIDTWTKDGPDLLHWLPRPDLDAWVAGARAAGLVTAIAGSLGAEAGARLRGCGAEVLGVRGAACEGGRSGEVTAARVKALKRALSGYPASAGG